MEPKLIRRILVVLIIVLAGLIALLLVKRTSQPTSVVVASPQPVATPDAPSNDKALIRIKRAGAVTAIERGDYAGAIATLSAIVKSGQGIGDEVELLGLAKELEEKYRKPAEPVGGGTGTGAPDEPAAPEVRPEQPTTTVVNTTPTTTPKPPVRRPTPAPRPAPVRPAAPEKPPEPATGMLLVTSVPTGLQVELDGRRGEFTPLRKMVEIGPHLVVILRRDEPIFRRQVNVQKDSVTTVDADLVEERAPAQPTASTGGGTTGGGTGTAAPTATGGNAGTAQPTPTTTTQPPADPPPEKPAPVAAAVTPAAPVDPPANGDVGELLIPASGIVGDVFIRGVGYGPPPVLAKGIPVGETAVELRSNGTVKRKKSVVVEKDRRVNVQFR